MSKFKIVEQLFLQTYNELYSTEFKTLNEIPPISYTGDDLKLISDNYYHRLLPDKVIRNERLSRQVKKLKQFIYFLLTVIAVLIIFLNQ